MPVSYRIDSLARPRTRPPPPPKRYPSTHPYNKVGIATSGSFYNPYTIPYANHYEKHERNHAKLVYSIKLLTSMSSVFIVGRDEYAITVGCPRGEMDMLDSLMNKLQIYSTHGFSMCDTMDLGIYEYKIYQDRPADYINHAAYPADPFAYHNPAGTNRGYLQHPPITEKPTITSRIKKALKRYWIIATFNSQNDSL